MDTSTSEPYLPSEADQKLIADVEGFFDSRKQDRRMHERAWFQNAAFRRGQHNLAWSDADAQFMPTKAPPHRERKVVNLIFPKVNARRAKALRNRPVPMVIPASTDRDDKLNARATQKVLDYLWRKLSLEARYADAIEWAEVCHKGFWWISWDETRMGRVRIENDLLPPPDNFEIVEAPLGDVCVESGSAYEVLVDDPSIADIQMQPRIMRIKLREVEEIKGRYKELAQYLKGDTASAEPFQYEKQIAGLNTRQNTAGLAILEERALGASRGKAKDPEFVVVKELFERPCPKYPKGRHIVVAGGVLLRSAEELPYGLWDTDTPYPVVEFVDVPTVGQFWGTTVIEQAIPLNKEYNDLISKLSENIRLMGRGKIITYKQHQLQPGAWSEEAGEIVELNHVPGLPPMQPWFPQNIAPDVWRRLEMIKGEIEDLFQIYPSSEGKVGKDQSGFQTNLLQEANDSVHAPVIRGFERAVESASRIMRRLMKTGYDVPRLISVVGRNYHVEAMEFSAAMIDEHADVRVEAGSALPTLKASKAQTIIDLKREGLFGDPTDPHVRRRILGVLDMASLDEAMELERRDEEQARLEIVELQSTGQIAHPLFFHNHEIHYAIHTDQLKAPETSGWPPAQILALIQHVIWHAYFINPVEAHKLAPQFGVVDLPPLQVSPLNGTPGGQGPPPSPIPDQNLAQAQPAPAQPPAAA